MSIVYNALDTVLGREVAIKMLKYEIASKTDFKKRFKQEAVTIAKLTHPNILHVIETIDDYSTSFIIMEKLDGYDLKYYLQEQGVFSGRQTCDIISQLALALEYAGNKHNGGIIHRDIKPANIVLDYQGNVKLMDFGIATTSSEVHQNFEGTLLYTAPEVLQKRPCDEETLHVSPSVIFLLLAISSRTNHAEVSAAITLSSVSVLICSRNRSDQSSTLIPSALSWLG